MKKFGKNLVVATAVMGSFLAFLLVTTLAAVVAHELFGLAGTGVALFISAVLILAIGASTGEVLDAAGRWTEH